jgi:hypothetical protein
MSNAPTSTMEHHMRFTFRLPPQLMVDYAHMQARIKKREATEWERFANSVAEYFQTSEDEKSPSEETIVEDENKGAGVVADVVVSEPHVVPANVEAPQQEVEVAIEKDEPKPEPVSYKLTSSAKKVSTGKVKPVENDTIVLEENTHTNEEAPSQSVGQDDNVSESGKRVVVRWTTDEDEYLKELMIRFENDYSKVAKEMKTRNARQCKARWELLNRPVNEESGKKKRGGAKKNTEEELTNEAQ